MSLSPPERAKHTAATEAVKLVEDGMTLGLGTGSTAAFFVELLAERLKETGWRVECVATSSATRALAKKHGVPLIELDDALTLDLTIDGADELDSDLDLIKGGGGALLQEKIVANASTRFVVIADASKHVSTLGAFPLPVEITRFAWQTTARQVRSTLVGSHEGGHEVRLRSQDGKPFVTDEGHYIIDLALGRIEDAGMLDFDLRQIPGVVETGLFLGMAEMAILGNEDGTVRKIKRDE